jgi:methionine-gamma-lyase
MTFDPVESLAATRHEFGEHGGVNMSIEASTTFTVMAAKSMPELFRGRKGPEGDCYLYARHFNPTTYVLGRYLAALEGTDAAYATASGMSAITATIMQLCRPGDEVVSGHTVYGGTFALFRDFLPVRTGIRTTFVDITDHDAVEAAITDRTKVLFCESLANPTLIVADLPRLARIASARGVTLVVDNTFCPMIVSPAQHGADVVIHSVTKFLSGASDTIAGAICGTEDLIRQMMDLNEGTLMLLGPVLDARIAFELSLRLPHLAMRMKAHGERALAFAERLDALGLPVTYPGLPSHPQHELLAALANPGFGSGGLLNLDLGSRTQADRFMETLQNRERFGFMAVSLGYFDTLMSCSAASTSSELTEDEQRAASIPPGLVRISIGYTGSLEQRWEQFERALSDVGLI